jgi:hypothetical protein
VSRLEHKLPVLGYTLTLSFNSSNKRGRSPDVVVQGLLDSVAEYWCSKGREGWRTTPLLSIYHAGVWKITQASVV